MLWRTPVLLGNQVFNYLSELLKYFRHRQSLVLHCCSGFWISFVPKKPQRLPRFDSSRTFLYHLYNYQWQPLHSFELVFMRTLFHQRFLPWTEHGKILKYQGTIKILKLKRVNFSSWLKVILITAVPSNTCCCN